MIHVAQIVSMLIAAKAAVRAGVMAVVIVKVPGVMTALIVRTAANVDVTVKVLTSLKDVMQEESLCWLCYAYFAYHYCSHFYFVTVYACLQVSSECNNSFHFASCLCC